jgi:hypothetical protein
MAQYYTGSVALPGGGAAEPICRVGPHGCLVVDTTGGGGGTYVGGPDVTTGTGIPLTTGTVTFIPGAMGFGGPVAPADPSHPAPVLYACSAGSDTVNWLSMLPSEPGPQG